MRWNTLINTIKMELIVRRGTEKKEDKRGGGERKTEAVRGGDGEGVFSLQRAKINTEKG